MRTAINVVLISLLVALASGVAQAPASPQGGPCWAYPIYSNSTQVSLYCQGGSLAQLSIEQGNMGTPQNSYMGGAVTFWKPVPGGAPLISSFGSNHNFVDGHEGVSGVTQYLKPNGTMGTLVFTRGLLTEVQ